MAENWNREKAPAARPVYSVRPALKPLVSQAVQAACDELTEAQQAYESLKADTGGGSARPSEREDVGFAADRRNKAILAIERCSTTSVDDGFGLLSVLFHIAPAFGGEDPKLLAAVYEVASKMCGLHGHEKSNGPGDGSHLPPRESRPQWFRSLSALNRLVSDHRRSAQ